MKKMVERMKNKQEGFTLIELIIVIAILAIIAVIAVPNILGAVENSRKAADVANAKIIYNAAAQVLAKNSNYDTDDAAGTNVTGLDATDTGFEGDLFDEINQTTLAPSFRASDFAAFTIVVDGNGRMSVQVSDGDDTYELAPEANAEYDQE